MTGPVSTTGGGTASRGSTGARSRAAGGATRGADVLPAVVSGRSTHSTTTLTTAITTIADSIT